MNLAQLNVARLKYPFEDPRVADFAENLDRINALADRSDGFVWRLQDEGGNAIDIPADADPMIIVNMSVWRDAESLERFRVEHRAQAVLPPARRVVLADEGPASGHVVGRRGA